MTDSMDMQEIARRSRNALWEAFLEHGHVAAEYQSSLDTLQCRNCGCVAITTGRDDPPVVYGWAAENDCSHELPYVNGYSVRTGIIIPEGDGPLFETGEREEK